MKIKKQSTRIKKKKITIDQNWDVINLDTAGIDLGSSEHWVCVPSDRDPVPVRRFGCCTPDLEQMAIWLKKCRITSVAMEATGVYWISVYNYLEVAGFKVVLANARQIKNVSGRKSDVLDCQWIQKLHTFGLIGASFRPKSEYCALRTLVRLAADLTEGRSNQILRMQKALKQMNIQLSEVLSDITGESGMAIITAILGGQRNPIALASLANKRVKSSKSQIAKALVGDYREEHLFELKMAFELYQNFEEKVNECYKQVTLWVQKLPNRVDITVKPCPPKSEKKIIDDTIRQMLYQKMGVDLTAIEGINYRAALTILGEIGPDLITSFPTVKHFTSWLGLCPDNRISGGKVLSSHTRRVVNQVADVLRVCATTLKKSNSYLGNYYRRMIAKLGPAAAVTAMAHKLARIIYSLLANGQEYISKGDELAEALNAEKQRRRLEKIAKSQGFILVPMQDVTAGVS